MDNLIRQTFLQIVHIPTTIFQKITAALIAAALPLLSGCSLDDAESYLTDTIQQAFGGEDGAEAENNGGSGTGSDGSSRVASCAFRNSASAAGSVV